MGLVIIWIVCFRNLRNLLNEFDNNYVPDTIKWSPQKNIDIEPYKIFGRFVARNILPEETIDIVIFFVINI